MTTLIIYAHPLVRGHSSFFLDTIIDRLEERKESFVLLDLYKERFDPVLKKEELYTAGKHLTSPKIASYQEMIRKSSHLIFVYPVWWNSMPAILKGFFDRVFVSRFAFRYTGKKFFKAGLHKKLLTGKRAAVFISSGAPVWASCLVQGLRAATLIRKDILGFFGVRAKVWQLGAATSSHHDRHAHIVRLVEKGIFWLYS